VVKFKTFGLAAVAALVVMAPLIAECYASLVKVLLAAQRNAIYCAPTTHNK